MSAQDQVYLRDDGDRVELLVDPGVLHVVEMPFEGPARSTPRSGFQDPDRVGAAFVRAGYARVREQPVARVLVDVAPDALGRVRRAALGDAAWARRLARKAFVAPLGEGLRRREAWALLRYVRLRHGRVVVLDARDAPGHRAALGAWLHAIAHDAEPLDEVVFQGARFHRDDRERLDAIAPLLTSVGFVGGLPRRLGAFAGVEGLTLAGRAPDGTVPAAAFAALADAGVDPISLSIELTRDGEAPAESRVAMLDWLRGAPRLRALSLRGWPLSSIGELTEGGLALERVRWQGPLTAAALEALDALPFALALSASPGSERGLAGRAPHGVTIEEGAPVCPWA